jgi:hypothetical protein
MTSQTATLPTTKFKTNAPIPANHRLTRKNVVPEGIIRIRAYQKWEAAGKPNGQSLRFWLEAERELLN